MVTLNDYVPRHKRLGSLPISCDIPASHDIAETISVVDDNGFVVSRYVKRVASSAADDMAKYRQSDFDLESLLEQGVPLKMINVNPSQAQSIERISKLAEKLDALDGYSKLVASQLAERDEFLKPFEESSKTE